MKVLPLCFGDYARCRDCDGRRVGAVYNPQPCIARDRCKHLPEYLNRRGVSRKSLLRRRRVEIDERGNVTRLRPHGVHRLSEKLPFLDDLDRMIREKVVNSSRRCPMRKVSGPSAEKLLDVFDSELKRVLCTKRFSEDGDLISAFDGELYWVPVNWSGPSSVAYYETLDDIRPHCRMVCRLDCRPRLRALDVKVMSSAFPLYFSARQLAAMNVVKGNGYVLFKGVKRRGVGTIVSRLATILDAGVF